MNFWDFFGKKDSNSSANKAVISGGIGLSFEDAVIISAPNSSIGIRAEYDYLSSIYGEREKSWHLVLQSLAYKDGKHYDILKIKLRDGSIIEYYFDISNFFGK